MISVDKVCILNLKMQHYLAQQQLVGINFVFNKVKFYSIFERLIDVNNGCLKMFLKLT